MYGPLIAEKYLYQNTKEFVLNKYNGIVLKKYKGIIL